MIITYDNSSLIDNDCYLHDSGITFIQYDPLKRSLNLKLDTMLDEETQSDKVEIIINNVQYIELDNQEIPYINGLNGLNGWECIPLSKVNNFNKCNIFNNKRPFAVMFEFLCWAKLYVVTTEIQFKRI